MTQQIQVQHLASLWAHRLDVLHLHLHGGAPGIDEDYRLLPRLSLVFSRE